MNTVVAQNVSMFFRDYQVRALSEVSLEVREGEIFGVAGPQRSGKSTLLKILAGQLRATDGTVRVFGGSPRRSSIKTRIGYLDQTNEGVSPTGWWLFGRARKGRSAGGAERFSRLKEAIVGKRDLIVLDEPLAGLDTLGRDEMLGLIRMLAGRGTTVILSTAAIDDAKGLCDRLAILYGGALQATGTLESLLTTRDAIRFLGPVLGTTAAERMIDVLRQELLREPIKSPAEPLAAKPARAVVATPDETANARLAQLVKGSKYP